jgi:hypothetical protein
LSPAGERNIVDLTLGVEPHGQMGYRILKEGEETSQPKATPFSAGGGEISPQGSPQGGL